MAKSVGTSPSRDPESRTILWTWPRTVSTAFSKCLSFIDGIEVWLEPYAFSRHTLTECKFHLNTDIPMEYEGNEEIFEKAKQMMDALTSANFEPKHLPYGSVKRRLESTEAKHVFVKDMGFAFDYPALLQYLPKGYKHTFLIRNPLRCYFSYRKAVFRHMTSLGVLQGEAADERTYDLVRDNRFFTTGYFVKELYDIWIHVKENIDSHPVIIDADDLLTKPKETLAAYCAAVGLPYHDGLLQWDGSIDSIKRMKASADDIVLESDHFAGTAIKSSRFLPPSKLPPRDRITPDVIRCSEEVMKYYDEMYEARMII